MEKHEPNAMPSEKQADDTPAIGPNGIEPFEEQEYQAWLQFMARFYATTGAREVEVNEKGGKWDELFIHLRVWSEKLAVLRRTQFVVTELDAQGYPSLRSNTG